MLTIQSAMPLISTVKGSQNVWSYTMSCASILLISKKQLRDVSDHVQLDPKMKVLGAVGKFHLSDHVDSCFSLWTLNFTCSSGPLLCMAITSLILFFTNIILYIICSIFTLYLQV